MDILQHLRLTVDTEADVLLAPCGTQVGLRPVSDAGKMWFDEWVDPRAGAWRNGSFCVSAKDADTMVWLMVGAGLNIDFKGGGD